MSINDDSFMGQDRSIDHFVSPSEEHQAKPLNLSASLADLPDTAVKILHLLEEASPNKLLTTELAELAYVHRSTISANCKPLYDLGLIVHDPLPGTENKVNPTYLYSLNSQHLGMVKGFLDRKRHDKPSLFQEIQTLEEQFPDQTKSVAEPSNPLPPSFQQQIVAVVNEMAKQIAVLKQEVNELKTQVKQSQQEAETCDLTKTLDLLQSLNTDGE